jgi:hypothetical protein
MVLSRGGAQPKNPFILKGFFYKIMKKITQAHSTYIEEAEGGFEVVE